MVRTHWLPWGEVRYWAGQALSLGWDTATLGVYLVRVWLHL